MSDHDASAADPDAPPADPDELDFTDDESVVEIGEGRYVVGTNGRPNVGRSRPQRGAADESGFTSADPASPAERQPPGADPQANAAAPGRGRGEPEAGRGGRSGQGERGGRRPAAEVDRQAVSRWLAGSFDGDGFTYGIDATLHADGDTTRQRMVSNDVTATFDSLVTWFASNAGPSSPTPEALGLLLVASETTVDVPPVAIKRFAASQGLTASDSIGDLVRAAEEAGGFRIQ
ncbi:hypothetical protein DJ73_00125 [Halorubrum sp. Ea1]|uniref:DUF7500 family protein n=1 Tax=Halorubrum sp. Ea1 TaxID=1480718 RepID=UPI000B97F99A|nr:hypothetical protein [Halorubrum sp. Ea1]OYR56407.1 hypothetical protein DJ73_00125 [Halorubrum sp. Ea1]